MSDDSVAATLTAQLARAGLDWIVPAWAAPHRVGALSTTRNSGNGATARNRSNRSNGGNGGNGGNGDDSGQLAALLPSPPVWLRQVHGAGVVVLDHASAAAARVHPPHADAAVTRERDIVCAVRTADCMPVLFADRAGTAVGVAHAGWRGLAAGVLEATIAALLQQGAHRDGLVAWLGPAIGPSAFEVGADVKDAFAATDPGSAAAFVALREGKWHADLYALARRRLAAEGVGDVLGGGWCTVSDPRRFYSYRRARDTGRMATLVWLHAGGPA